MYSDARFVDGCLPRAFAFSSAAVRILRSSTSAVPISFRRYVRCDVWSVVSRLGDHRHWFVERLSCVVLLSQANKVTAEDISNLNVSGGAVVYKNVSFWSVLNSYSCSKLKTAFG